MELDRQHQMKVFFKGLVLMSNVLLIVFGCAVVAIGIWMLFDAGVFDMFLGLFKFLYPAAVVIASGLLSLVVSSCGFWSVQKEHRCLLITYICLVVLILVAELVAGGIAFEFKLGINAVIKNETTTIVKNKYGTGDKDIDHAVDMLQERFKCCGASKYTDYDGSQWIKALDKAVKYVPESCCSDPAKCTVRTVAALVYDQGCHKELSQFTSMHMTILAVICVVVGGVQFLGVCFAAYLYSVL